MAMVSLLPCCAPLTGFSSSSFFLARLPNPLVSTIASLGFGRSDFQLLNFPSVCTRRNTKWRKHQRQCQGVAFASFGSIRDAEELVKSGLVRPVSRRDISGLLYEEGYMLLDVRPIWEREKAYVTGSYHVPLFVEDLDTGPLTFIKKGIQAGQGGWWMGQKLTTRNENFVEEVQAAVPVGQKLVVACGEGLRSLLALNELNDAGFEQMAWITGGFNAVRDDDFLEVEGVTELRFATVGGASEYVLKFALLIQGLVNFVKGAKSIDST